MGEKGKRAPKENVEGRSTSSHDSKKFRTRSMEKQRGVAFGFRKTVTAVKIYRTDGRADGRTDRWMDGRMDGWTDGWMDGQTDGWMDRRMDGWTDRDR